MNNRAPKRKVVIAAFTAILIIAIGLIALAYHTNYFSAIEVEARSVRAQDLPASVAELEKWYPQVSGDDNAAPELVRFLVEDKPGSVRNYASSRSGFPEAVKDKHGVVRYNTKYEERFKLLAQAHTILQRPQAHFVVSGTTLTERTQFLDNATKLALLEYSAGLDYVELQRWPEAFGQLQDLLRLSNLLRFYPDDISDETVQRIQLNALDLIADCLASGQFTEPELKSLDELLRAQLDDESLYRKLVTWRCYYLDGQRAQTGSPLERALDAQNAEQILIYAEQAIAAARLPIMTAYHSSNEEERGVHDREIKSPVASPDRLIRIEQIVYSSQRALDKPLFGFDTYAAARKYIKTLLGTGASYDNIRSTASIQIIRVGVAIERYRIARRTGPPETLDALVPEFLESRPNWPANNDIEYSSHGNSYVVEIKVDFIPSPNLRTFINHTHDPKSVRFEVPRKIYRVNWRPSVPIK